jgi:hypothetical protein
MLAKSELVDVDFQNLKSKFFSTDLPPKPGISAIFLPCLIAYLSSNSHEGELWATP